MDDNLFYTCSLIEYIGRETKNNRKYIVDRLEKDIDRIYEYADVFHCEPIEKVCYDFIERRKIENGNFDAEAKAKYRLPSYWEIGKVFEHLIEDTAELSARKAAVAEVFSSWIAERLLDYNTDLYYQPREYLAECYREGKIIEG